jgi:DNA-binding transcriptional ArsR family regulator
MEAVLKALAEPRRMAILKLIGNREMQAGAIADRFKLTRPAISQHLRVLTEAHLLIERREGTRRLYRVRQEGFAELRDFLDRFWNVRLSSLKHVVERDARKTRRAR